jgi:hypothetical protein
MTRTQDFAEAVELLNKWETKARACLGKCERQAARIVELEAALDGMLDWALRNRDTEYEFVACRTDGDKHDPALEAARVALAKTREKEEVTG